MKSYNGHRSYNAWNISLWINNEEWIYNLIHEYKLKFPRSYKRKVFEQLKYTYGDTTPDGIKWTFLNVKEAIEE